jgi:nucleoside-triphosphatase
MPGVGKTTVIRTVADMLAAQSLAGFYTEEIRERGERKGFRLVGFGGERGVIAHLDLPHTHRVGKYGVDVAIIDRLAVETLRPDEKHDVYLVDEIGKMECLSARFVKAMRVLMDTGRFMVATISRKGGGFIVEVKARPDVVLWEVTQANRDTMPERVVAWLSTSPQDDTTHC